MPGGARETTSEIDSFLDERLKVQVATNGSDGYPHLATLWRVLGGDRVVFRSFTKSRRIVNLGRDPRVTLVVEDGVAHAELRGVIIRGEARLTDDPGRVLDVYARVRSEATGSPIDRGRAEDIFGRFAAKNTVVAVEPAHVASRDRRRLGGTYRDERPGGSAPAHPVARHSVSALGHRSTSPLESRT